MARSLPTNGSRNRFAPVRPALAEHRAEAASDTRRQLFEARNEVLRLSAENVRMRSEGEGFTTGRNLHGNSQAIEKAWRQIVAAADHPGPVVVYGEPGVGKRRAAFAVIELNRLQANTAIAFDCTLPDTARQLRRILDHPDGFTHDLSAEGIDTLFLDTADALEPSLLQRLGPLLRPTTGPFRVIATGGETLADRLDPGTHLGTPPPLGTGTLHRIYLAPLRQRRSDIVPLTEKLIERFNAQLGRNVRRISTPAIELLMAYRWPGNVGELASCLRRGVEQCRDAVLQAHHLPMTLRTAQALPVNHGATLQQALDQLEYEMLVEALETTAGNGRQAAQRLGLTERKLGLRLRKHGLTSKGFRY